MTAKQIFEYALVELNKKEAPSLLLEDYNYFINKAINQYINRVYNIYDVDQQRSDDLRVLKSTAILTPGPNTGYTSSDLFSKVYEANLPDDYLHLLGCTVEYLINKTYRCYDAGDYFQIAAKRLTADVYPNLLNNYYLRPSYKNPYYYINNINVSNDFPTSDSTEEVITSNFVINVTKDDVTTSTEINVTLLDGTTITVTAAALEEASSIGGKLATDGVENTVVGNTITITDVDVSNVVLLGPGLYLSQSPSSTRTAKTRYGNNSKVRLEIRYGKDNSVFELKKIYVDYLKAPKFVRLTQDQMDRVEDTSQHLEYPDYVCQEIVNELIKLLMENSSDPRLNTHIPINNSIGSPAAAQQPQQRK